MWLKVNRLFQGQPRDQVQGNPHSTVISLWRQHCGRPPSWVKTAAIFGTKTCPSTCSLGSLFVEVRGQTELDTHTHTHTHCRKLLDEGSDHLKYLYLRTHSTHKRQTSMPRRDSNSHSQQARARRPTPYTARPLGSDRHIIQYLSYLGVCVGSLPSRSNFFRYDVERLWIGNNTQVHKVCAQQFRVVFNLMRRNFLCHFVQLTFVTMVTVTYNVYSNCTAVIRLPLAGWVACVITSRQVS
jgi:hypothetical protein